MCDCRRVFANGPISNKLVTGAVLLFALCLAILDASAAAIAGAAYRADRILVKPKVGITAQALQTMNGRGRTLIHRSFPDLGNWQVIQLPPDVSVPEALAYYRASGMAEAVEPDFLIRLYATPNDPSFRDGTLWALHNTGQSGGARGADIGAPAGWDSVNSAPEVIVAVIDSGARYTHSDLAANLWTNPGEIAGNGLDDDGNGVVDDVHGINAIANSGDPMDDDGHGTHVAGIIGAVGNNDRGVVGVMWNARLMLCKFTDATGEGFLSDAIQCIDYARRQGARIMNASWGSTGPSLLLRAAIDRARQAGILFVTAAGNETNDNDATPDYPSAFPLDNIVSVAATTRTDELADYSNFGTATVDLAAPGSAIYSTWNLGDDDYEFLSGTSMAAPCVTGALALLQARFPNASHVELIRRLLAATDRLPSLAGRCVSGGRLNLDKALNASVLAAFRPSSTSGSAPVTVAFTDESIGNVATWTWDFGDGTPTSTERNPSHTFQREGHFTVRLTVTDAGGERGETGQPITVVANYTIEPVAFAWVDPAGMSQVAFDADGVSGPLPLPFPFHFFGRLHDTVYMGVDGLLGFSPEGLAVSSNIDLPNAAVPNAVLFPYWDNLRPTVGAFHFGVVGTAPDRRAVVSWVNVQRQGGPTTTLTFQAVLEERSNAVLYQYLEVDPSRTAGAGRSATIGLENESGTVAAKYSFDGQQPLSNGQALLFVSRSGGGLVVTPDSAPRAVGPVGGPFSTASQIYTIRNTGTGDLDWRVSKAQDWISVSSTGGSLRPGMQTNVTIALHPAANSLPAGTYADRVEFVNAGNGLGNTSRSVTLTVNGTTGVLSISPESGLSATGPHGGPFSGTTQLYTLVNTGDATLDWAAGKDVDWVEFTPPSGALGPGASTTVKASLAPVSTSLETASYSGTAVFWNITNGRGDSTRALRLMVSPPLSPPGLRVVSFDGSLTLQLTGAPGTSHTIEESRDLLSWSPGLEIATGPGGTITFTAPGSMESGPRYYRAKTNP